ncbi:uncharacterized protein C1orf198 homolog [Apis florea]|uniref:uncharacterized protein C1orf198 homolog n=1 Tax=Apis florea TaxID=7463 RepID=UPI000252C3AC|nr:uncharacterized protein C1orf198 homolog [Apis florea]XP_003697945.1 uncharacterized protein C1orf198 homolog [Apis florea]XP_012348022.1 uncharacterized protein C1orf198 homolog [Apis florea]XP_031775356.1 uncharacterized protein C1orf198 homolog [Apis florea]
MSAMLNSRAEQYFYSINPLAQRIGEDITATKEAYEGLWNTLSIAERNQAINETIIQPEVALKYTLKKPELTKELPEWYPKLCIQTGMKYVIDETGSTLRWRDEHSAPFSFMTQSQMNLSIIDTSEDVKSKLIRAQFGESPHFSSPAKSQKNNSNSINDTYTSSHTVNCFQSDCFSNNIFEDEQCCSLLKGNVDSDHSESIFAKLMNKTSLLKLQNNLAEDMESLVRERDSDTDKSQTNTLVVMSRTKSSDINESTALLETPSSYSSFQSSQLNQEEEERIIPKTGFEFLDNW